MFPNQSIKVSIITPSLNQVEFLPAAIQSVLSQNYSNLEYRIIDGGSTDGSIEVIRSYNSDLTFWCSEPDAGQYSAINKGFEGSTGSVMAWLNSDDMYTPWTLKVVTEIFSTLPEVEWITTLCPLVWSASGTAIYCAQRGGYTRKGFFLGENIPHQYWYALGAIQQESVFWRRSLWEKAGAYLDTTYALAADFELWARFFQHADLYTVAVPLAGFRYHGNQRSVRQAEQYLAEANQILTLYGGHPPNKIRGVLTKIAKDYIRLPFRFRNLAFKLGLKLPHRHCIYNSEHQLWEVIDL